MSEKNLKLFGWTLPISPEQPYFKWSRFSHVGLCFYNSSNQVSYYGRLLVCKEITKGITCLQVLNLP